jgi:hypothetical protein
VPGDAVRLERLQQRLLEAEHVFLDVDAEPAQVDERVRDDLPGPVVSHLAAAVGAHDRDRAGGEHVLVAAGEPLREHRRVLAQPHLVGGPIVARRRERAHGVEGDAVRQRAEHLDLHRRRAPRLAVLRARP